MSPGQANQRLPFDFVPYNAAITLNSYREADQATITLPFRALPLDPRVIRACAIQVFCGAVAPMEYAESQGPIAGESTVAVVTDDIDADTTNEVFRGFVDVVEIAQMGNDTLTLECRDLTGPFLDQEVTTQGLSGLPRDMPIDEVIRQIIIGEGDTPEAAAIDAAEESDRQTLRGQRRGVARRRRAVLRKLEKLRVAAIAANPDEPEEFTRINIEISQLLVQRDALSIQLTRLRRDEADQDAQPSTAALARRFGMPGVRSFPVVNETRFDVLPNLADVKGVKWFNSAGKTKKASSAGSRTRINYWDMITDIVVASGFVCYIRRPSTPPIGGDNATHGELVITEPRTYYGDAPGQADAILPEFTYGLNCNEVTVRRSLTGKNAPTHIQVNALTSETGRLVTSRFPPIRDTEGVANRATPSELGERIEVQTLTYKGAIPEARAKEILGLVAEKIYEELSRGEFEVTIRTKSQLSFMPGDPGPNASPDVFQMRAGDSIRIGQALTQTPELRDGLVSQVGVFAAMTFGDRVRFFVSAGLSPGAATAAAEAYENDRFQDVYRLRTMGIQWDHNSGFEFEIAAVNYLDARNALDNVE